jgi:hypothetical protein
VTEKIRENARRAAVLLAEDASRPWADRRAEEIILCLSRWPTAHRAWGATSSPGPAYIMMSTLSRRRDQFPGHPAGPVCPAPPRLTLFIQFSAMGRRKLGPIRATVRVLRSAPGARHIEVLGGGPAGDRAHRGAWI